ncbi:MAG: magnesium/cobalt transporter CorA, partial [Bacillota bacterium]|nr:magnesium/cobalt transporter CorA [Bacillota bacterium]
MENQSQNSNKISAISYSKDKVFENPVIDDGFFRQYSNGFIHWIDIGGLNDTDKIEFIGKNLGLHHLIIEDILNTNQMTKLDNYEDSLFIVLKTVKFDSSTLNSETQHVSIILKGNYLVSFRESDRDIFSGVREKILSGEDYIRKSSAGFLCYELIDAIVDNYFTVLDHLGDATDEVEEELISSPSKKTLQKIYFIKRELMFLRKSVFPLRELIGGLTRYESVLKSENIDIYLRDVYDHLIQIVDTLETYQDIMSNMLDTYLSSIGNRTNDTMKILTIFSTIFIPLTF